MKKIIMVMLLSLIMLTGCSEIETHENGVPIYFLEPEGYIIAKVKTRDNSSWLVERFDYGYILEEDYESYLDGNMKGSLVIKHPYEYGKEVSVPYREIMSINIGVYKDYR